MKVENLFKCEYCGFESQNPEEVNACEQFHALLLRIVKVAYNRTLAFPKQILVEGEIGEYAIYQLTGECSKSYNPDLFVGVAPSFFTGVADNPSVPVPTKAQKKGGEGV